ncbi:MAG: ROK family protein [Bacteroidia bacterium]
MEILGLDIGGSGIKAALVDTEQGILLSERYRVDTPQPSAPWVVADAVYNIVEHFNWKGPVGCGFPAPMQHGVARNAANIDPAWINTNVEALFRERINAEVSVVNDADAAGVAEMHFGAGHNRKGLIMLLTIGTGIGSALIIDGKLVPNTELGHLRFKGGIAEHYASDSARRKEDLSWKEWGRRFNEYLWHVHQLFYPDLIILGGGISRKLDKFMELIDVPVSVVPAEFRNEAGIVGAAVCARDHVLARLIED